MIVDIKANDFCETRKGWKTTLDSKYIFHFKFEIFVLAFYNHEVILTKYLTCIIFFYVPNLIMSWEMVNVVPICLKAALN